MSRAGQIMISHLKGNFFAIAARRTDSFTSSRTTNVPTAPMLMIPNLPNCLAMAAGWHRFAPPTFTARRNTTQRMLDVISVQLLLTICIQRSGHASNDLPRSTNTNPCMRDSHCVGPGFGSLLIGPIGYESIIVDRDFAGHMNGELLDRVRLELDAFGRVGSDPIGDVILVHGCRTDKRPANEILVP